MASLPISDFYSVKATPDKGRGLFAKKTLPAGFLLFEDKPLFTPGSLMKDILKEMQSWKGQKMPSCQTLERQAIPGVHWKMAFWDLHNAFPSTGCHEVGVYRTNRVQTSRENETVFRIVSLMNHSCVPNAFYSFHIESQKARVYIVRQVLAGEEITRDYGTDSELHRHEWLKRAHGLSCNPCPAVNTTCRLGKYDLHWDYYILLQEGRIKRILEDRPARRFSLVGLQTVMLLKDGIVDGRLSKAVEDAFLITAGQNDMRRAEIFAKWLLKRQIICFGLDSPEAHNAEHMLNSPHEFMRLEASTDWVECPNDEPLQDTPFEFHMWLWRVDDPTLLPETHLYLLALNFPGQMNAAEKKRVTKLQRRLKELGRKVRGEQTSNAAPDLVAEHVLEGFAPDHWE